MFIIPAFNPTDQPLQYLKYARYGETPLEVAGYIITHPLSLFEGYGGLGKLNYIIFLLTPVGFLALLYPPLLATGIFSFATIFLSDANDLLLGKYQYSTSLVAPLILATIFGITWLVKRIKNVDSQRLIIFFTSTILFINVCLLFFHQWTPLSFSSALSIAYSPEKAKAAQEAIKLVPSNASVVASWRLGSHLAQRRNLFLIDTPYRVTADYVVITKYTEVACEEKPSQLRSCEATAEDYQKYVQEISSHPHYQPIFDQADIMVFKRIQPAKE